VGGFPTFDDFYREAGEVSGRRSSFLAGDLSVATADALRRPGAILTPLLSHQVPPQGSWFGWMMLAGRGSGKTEAAARYVKQHIYGPSCMPGEMPHNVGIVGPTQGDAVTSCYNGPSGLRAHDPSCKLRVEPGGTIIRWQNGSQAKVFGVGKPDEVERLRAGGNTCLVWAEELAAWRYMDDGYDQVRFGLRIGPDPRIIITTTPKPRPLVKKLRDDPDFTITTATTDDNPYLVEHVRRALFDRYGGRAIGRQELYGEIIEEDESALWRREWLERGRLPAGDLANVREELVRLTVGVDPSGGAGEQGIVIAGKGRDGHGYTLGDWTVHLNAAGWGRRAVEAWLEFEADDIVAETNFGGDMVAAVVNAAARTLELEGQPTASVPVRKVHASRGKRVRAEPVAALFAADEPRWHHVGYFAALEDQLCTWTPEAGYSPDRLDAEVWTGWHMGLASTVLSGTGSIGWEAASSANRLPTGPQNRIIDPRTMSPWRR
jgi:phage terminase large subunit-like protein